MLKFVFFLYYFFFVWKREWGDVLYNIIYGEKMMKYLKQTNNFVSN